MRKLRTIMLLIAGISMQGIQGQPPSAPPGGTASPPRMPGEFATVFTEVAKRTIPSVVSITTERSAVRANPSLPFDDPFDFFFNPGPRPPQSPRREQGLGSGVIVAADGLILTNNHVVEGAGKIMVQLSDRREFPAKVVGTDPATDLAVVRIEGKPGKLPALPYGNSDSLEIGAWVIAVGAPFGLYQTVTNGIVSAVGRQGTGITTYGNFIQTDAAINPGNSGGPLVDLQGRLMGINTAIYSRSGGYQGIGFAIPVNLARRVADDLVRTGKVTRGWLGVSIQTMSPAMADAMGLESSKGALVGDVLPGGPAAEAGLRRGDVILKVGGREVLDANALMNLIAETRPGSTVPLTLFRDGKTVTSQVRIAEKKDDPARPGRGSAEGTAGEIAGLGLQAAPLSPDMRTRFGIPPKVEKGVVVTQVIPGSRAAGAGLEAGDVLLEAGKTPITSLEELRAALRKASKGTPVLLLVWRQGSTFFSALSPE